MINRIWARGRNTDPDSTKMDPDLSSEKTGFVSNPKKTIRIRNPNKNESALVVFVTASNIFKQG